MDSMRVDCDEPVRIADRAELDRYMDGSAARRRADHGPAARRAPEPERRRPPRRRLPADELPPRRARGLRRWTASTCPGLAEDDLRAAHASGHLRERVAQEVGRARALFAETARGRRGLAPRMRHGVAVARRVYTCVLDRVEHNGYDVLGARVRLRPGRPRGAALRAMTRRATTRGDQRTSLDGTRADVLVCGASFAGLAVARELARSAGRPRRARRRPLRDRRAPDERLRDPDAVAARAGPAGGAREELPDMTFTTPHGSVRYRLPWSWTAFDYRTLCRELWAQCGAARFETAKVERAHAATSCTPTAATCTPR